MSVMLQDQVDAGALREKAQEVAKRHKASWVELGQYLYAIYHDKHYRGWGYLNFETYCMKELRIKQQTAVKLLKSYYFLEQEKPELTKPADGEGKTKAFVPDYEAVNLLRLAKNNKKLKESDYQELSSSVLEGGRGPKDVRSQMKAILSEQDERTPDEIRQERRQAAIKRLLTVLNHAKTEFSNAKFVPAYLVKQISDLTEKLEDQLN